MSHELPIRQVLQMLGAVAVNSLLPPLDIRPSIAPRPVMEHRSGILRVYASNTLMEAQVPYRLGLNEDLYWYGAVRSRIAQAEAVAELRGMKIDGYPLVSHKRLFDEMAQRMGPSLFSMLQGLVDPQKPWPYFIAPDTLLFYPQLVSSPHRSQFIGRKATLSTMHEIDALGDLVLLDQPKQAHAYIMDVRTYHDHMSGDGALSDTDPYTSQDFLGCVWNGTSFQSEAGSSIKVLPEVEIGIPALEG